MSSNFLELERILQTTQSDALMSQIRLPCLPDRVSLFTTQSWLEEHCRGFSHCSTLEGSSVGSQKNAVVGRMIIFQRCPHSYTWKLWICYLHGKRDFADAINVKGLEMGRLSWIVWVSQSNHKSLKEGEEAEAESERYNEGRGRTESKCQRVLTHPCCFESRGREAGTRKADSL